MRVGERLKGVGYLLPHVTESTVISDGVEQFHGGIDQLRSPLVSQKIEVNH